MVKGILTIILLFVSSAYCSSVYARNYTIPPNSTYSSSSSDSASEDVNLWHRLFDDLDRTTTASYVAAAFSTINFAIFVGIGLTMCIKYCVEKKKDKVGNNYGSF